MLVQFIFAFLYSVIFALILTFVFKRRGPGPFHGILYFFCIILLFTFSFATLIKPIGPKFMDVPWFSILGFAFVIMLLIGELLPHKDKASLVKKRPEEDIDEEVLDEEFGAFFWIILLVLVAAIIYAVFSHFTPVIKQGYPDVIFLNKII